MNGCESATFQEGTIRNEPEEAYDVVIANINRNILLNELSEYASRLQAGGYLLLSGFYSDDIPILLDAALPLELQLEEKTSLRNWACLRLRKA